MKTLIILANVSEAERAEISFAFETREEATWPQSVEQYGYGLKNMDEVLTHIRFGQMNDANPNLFKIVDKKANFEGTFAIIVRGDSYYEKRIRRQSYAIIQDEMHDVVGLFGNWEGDNVASEQEIDKVMNTIQSETEDPSFESGDVQIEDNLVFYKKISINDLLEKYSDDDEDEEILLDYLNLNK